MNETPDIHSVWKDAQEKERKIWLESNQPESYFIEHWSELLRKAPLILRSLSRAEAVLDVACGGVPILHALPRTKRMVATDPLNRDFAVLYPRKEWIQYDHFCAESLPYEDAAFDVVFCMNALDHMSNPQVAVRQMLRVLKPGGWLHLDVTNTSPLARLVVALGYRRHLCEFHPHVLTLASVLSWLRNGCEIAEVETFPSCSIRKLLYGLRVFSGKEKLSGCQQRISAFSLPRSQMLISVFLDMGNGALYRFGKKTFAQGGRIAARKLAPGATA